MKENIECLAFLHCIVFRPPLDLLENSFDFVRDCLKECWAENPDDRPEFKTIRNKLRPMRKGMYVLHFIIIVTYCNPNNKFIYRCS